MAGYATQSLVSVLWFICVHRVTSGVTRSRENIMMVCPPPERQQPSPSGQQSVRDSECFFCGFIRDSRYVEWLYGGNELKQHKDCVVVDGIVASVYT